VSDGPELTPDDVKEILRLVDEAEFDEFELETPQLTIRFRRGEAQAPQPANDRLHEVTSPMVGTFYLSPSPGAPPFVEVGSAVEETTQVCILEVMKLMNSVAAGVRGVVAEVCVENTAPVQFGDVLFRIRPA
jgi:acetyl-CoA carboxylase biotin carboxyl carrier protein